MMVANNSQNKSLYNINFVERITVNDLFPEKLFSLTQYIVETRQASALLHMSLLSFLFSFTISDPVSPIPKTERIK